MDIGEIHRRAAAFRKRLNSVKRKLGGKDLRWYPYDTLLVFSVLERMLTGERRYFVELAGARPVLDIGCGDGDMAFFLESLGCRVDAIDFSGTNFNQMHGVKALKQAQDSAVGIFDINLDQPFVLPRSGYGLTICLGLLYHLKNPYYLLETLARATHYCLLSTRVARLTPDHRTSLEEHPVAYLLDESEANNDPTNFWIFSETGLRRILNRTGWQVCDYLTTGCQDDSDPSSGEHDQRAFCLLRSPVYDRRWSVTLLEGWHPIESGHFRWTERRFSVRMETAGSGACSCLSLAFFLPDEMGTVTLGAKINGHDLPPQVFSHGGECKYRQPVPPGAVTGGIAEIEFTVDRSVAPRRGDQRELGLVVSFAREGCALSDANLPLELE
ncbi:MAG: class I SAM-dependent methyltransferase [Bryobacteraceae bacterium]